MAITNITQRKEYASQHWFYYQDIVMPDDMSGNDHIELRHSIRVLFQSIQEELLPHGIKVVDVRVEEGYDYRSFEKLYRVAFGFENKEDLAMAKLLIDPKVDRPPIY